MSYKSFTRAGSGRSPRGTEGVCMIVRQKSQNIRKFLARFSACTKAAFCIALAVLVIGLCTAGTARSTGGDFYATEETSVVFYLDYQDGATLNKIHVNVGTAYVPAGSSFTVTFRSALRSSTSSSSWSSSYGLGAVTFSNIYMGTDSASTNHNWVTAVDRTDSSSTISSGRCLVRVTFSCEMLVNEIAFEDANGERIPAYVTASEARERFEAAGNAESWSTHFRNYFTAQEKYDSDVTNLVDGDVYTAGSTPYTNYTQDEMYTLAQIDGILLGGRIAGGTFVADTDHGPFAALLPLLGVLIFGRSPFGLRFFSVLFSAALVFLVYRFVRALLSRGGEGKEGANEGFALLAAALTAGGGLVLTVGRLGLVYPVLAFLLVGAFYFMHRFFAFGLDREQPARSACNILTSGLCFAFAVACDPKAILAAAGLVALFVAGAVKHARAYAAERRAARQALSGSNAHEPSDEVIRANLDAFEERSAAERTDYLYRSKLIYLLFFVSFVVGTVLIYALAGLPQLSVYAQLYDPDPAAGTVGALTLLGRSFRDAFALGNATAFSSGNAVSAFGWFLSLKGATLFWNASETSYIALNAQGNILMAFTALFAFLFMTVYAILYAATGRSKGNYATEHAPLALRAYLVLLAGLVSALLPYAFIGGSSAAQSLPFTAFYFAFIPLAFYTAYVHDGSAKKKLFGVACMNTTVKVLTALVALYAVVFVLTLPMTFGFPFPAAAAAACFGWTSILNNGFYR